MFYEQNQARFLNEDEEPRMISYITTSAFLDLTEKEVPDKGLIRYVQKARENRRNTYMQRIEVEIVRSRVNKEWKHEKWTEYRKRQRK